MADSRFPPWWLVWTMPVIGVLFGAIGTYYNVNIAEHSSVAPPVRDCLPLLLVLYLASWPGWSIEMFLDVLNGPVQWDSHLPFLLGQAFSYAILGLLMHLSSLARRSLARRWRARVVPTGNGPPGRP